MVLLDCFSGSGALVNSAIQRNIDVVSLDKFKIAPGSHCHLKIDFLDFNFKFFEPDYFDFLFFGFPCTTTSKASNGFHFENKYFPKTDDAAHTIKMLYKMREIITYFDKAVFIIENPVSALFSNYWFRFYIQNLGVNTWRMHQFNYGHLTFKQTDLFTNSHVLWMCNPVHRINGKNAVRKFSNLSLKQRQSYPPAFADAIINYFILSKKNA